MSVSKMSDVPGAVKKGLQELKDEITCPICQEFFQDPKILPCFHYYCKQCVLQLAAREQPFPCPECRGDTLLPPTGADGFPTAFFVHRLKSLHSAMEKVQEATSSGDLICEQCHSDKAVAFCRHCAHFICNHCRESHRRMKAFSGHTVVSIEELRRNAEENIPIVQPEPMKCEEHQEQLKIYCFTCCQLICRDCVVIDHKDHSVQFTSKYAPEIKQALQEKLGPLQSTQAHIQDARKQLEQSGNEITAQGTHLEKVINGSFDEMIEVLEQRRCELLTTVRGRVEKKLSSLSSQEKCLEMFTARIQSLVDFVGQNIGNASDEEIVSIHKQLQCKIEEEMKSCNSLDLTPAVSANIGVDISCAAEIAELCQKKTSVITLVPECRAEGPGIEGAVTNTPTQLVVHTFYSNRQPCREKQSIRAELRSMVDGSIVVAEVTEKEKGSYLVSYCPKVRGRHKLILLVNQQPIAGSPLDVFVEHPPTQLGKPVCIIDELERPYAIALNKSGHLLVTQPEKGLVTALSKDGRVLPGGKDGLKSPLGLAVDEDGSLLVTTCISSTQQLIKFNKDWTLAKVVGQKGTKPGQFDNIGRVNISPTTHKYYVCDRLNGRIQVFDQDLHYVSSLHLKYPTDVAFDDAGHVYVADFKKHEVQKFSPREEPLMTFGSHTAAKGKLHYPVGVHVSRQFVYVTDGTPSVSVFTTDGAFVTSFGKEDLHDPRGITADEDGFLYVCSWNKNSNRIIVY